MDRARRSIAAPLTLTLSPRVGRGRLAESLASRRHDDIASSEPRGAEKMLVRGLPDPPFHRVEQACEHDEEDHDSEADSLSLGEIRLSRPGQKGRDVPGVIVQGRLGAVLVL